MSPQTEGERLATAEAAITELRGDVKAIRLDIREMRNTLAGRPSWPVATLLAGLMSTCVGLAVALATTAV